MPTTRVALDFLGTGSTLDGSTYYDFPTTLPASGVNGWQVLEIAQGSTLGRIRASSLVQFVGLGGFFIREVSIDSRVEASFALALRPPQGNVVLGGRMIEGIITSQGFNGGLPGAWPFQNRPVYVPPGWEIAMRCGDGAFGAGNLEEFVGSIGLVLDSIRDFEEAAMGFLALDFNRPARPEWT